MNVLILDGALPSALAATRALGEGGATVAVAAERKTAMALHSKYAGESLVFPSPMTQPEAFIKAVEAYTSSKSEKTLVYSFSDPTSLLLSRHRDELKRTQLFLPDEAATEIAFDKFRTLKLAESLDIPMPKTYFFDTPSQLEDVDFRYPLIVKPRHSCVWYPNFVWGKAESVSDKAMLNLRVKNVFNRTGEMPLVQEKIKGKEFGVFFLYDHGVDVARFAHERVRSLHPSGGASALRRSIYPPESLLHDAKRLLDALKWHGPAMVEFKRDDRDGRYKLMEINGRLWGSLALAVYAGVDFPKLMLDMAQGVFVEMNGYEESVVSRYFLGDTLGLIRVLSTSRLTAKQKMKRLSSFLKFQSDRRYDVESWSDPAPALWQWIDLFVRKPISS